MTSEQKDISVAAYMLVPEMSLLRHVAGFINSTLMFLL